MLRAFQDLNRLPTGAVLTVAALMGQFEVDEKHVFRLMLASLWLADIFSWVLT